MEDVKPALNFYLTRLSNKFNQLSKPLHEFALDGFWYSYVNTDGGFFQLGNQPGVAEIYLSNYLYIHNPFIHHPDHYLHNQVLTSIDLPDEKFHEAQDKVYKVCGFNKFLFIYKKCGKNNHILHYGSSHKNVNVSSIFLNHLPLLNAFADYFLQEWEPHFATMDSYMIDLAKDMGPKFLNVNPCMHQKPNRAKNINFMKQMGWVDEYYEKLTDREFECIDQFLKGKTARQIGDFLHISHRTVEHHLENIKLKMFCSTKLELFEKLQTYKKFNILSA